MRVYDAFTIALLVAFLACALVGAGRWRLWSSVLSGGAAIACLLHLGVEHNRWQMAPAYLVLIAVLVSTAAMYRQPLRRWLASRKKARIALSLSAMGVLALSVVASWLFPLFELPHPTGPFAVGTTEFHFVDTTRAEPHTGSPVDRRELMVRAWYPATAGAHGKPVAYLPHAAAVGRAINNDHWPFGYPLMHLARVSTNSFARAPLPKGQDAYPVLVFSHGLSMGHAGQNTVLVEELASRGYVVFAIDHAHDGLATVFPDGRVALFSAESYDAADPEPSKELRREEDRLRDTLDAAALLALAKLAIREQPQESQMRRYWYEVWSQDQRFVLDQIQRLQSGELPSPFTGRLQLSRIGVFGMSFGGVAAARTCALDSRCKAGINLDGFGAVAIESPPHSMPFMYFSNGSISSNALFLDLDRGYRYFVKVRGAEHMDFSDAPLLSPLAKLTGASGPIDTSRMLALTNAYVTAFFDRHLLGKPAALLSGPSPAYPQVRFLVRAPTAGTSTPSDDNATAPQRLNSE